MPARLYVAILLGLALGGCGHRISLDEFLELQTEQQAATARPAQEKSSMNALLNQRLGPYKLGPGDIVWVTVTPSGQAAPSAPVQVRVRSDGTIELPLAGVINVKDETLEAAEAVIQDAYVPQYHRQAIVHVQVIEPATTTVLVVGAIPNPGLIKLRSNERNLLYAVASAGGATDVTSGIATLKRIRQRGTTSSFNLLDPDQLCDALAMEPLENGDIVEVHTANPNTIFFGSLGNVE